MQSVKWTVVIVLQLTIVWLLLFHGMIAQDELNRKARNKWMLQRAVNEMNYEEVQRVRNSEGHSYVVYQHE